MANLNKKGAAAVIRVTHSHSVNVRYKCQEGGGAYEGAKQRRTHSNTLRFAGPAPAFRSPGFHLGTAVLILVLQNGGKVTLRLGFKKTARASKKKACACIVQCGTR